MRTSLFVIPWHDMYSRHGFVMPMETLGISAPWSRVSVTICHLSYRAHKMHRLALGCSCHPDVRFVARASPYVSFTGAAESAETARRFDLSDRYLNSMAVKALLRADQVNAVSGHATGPL